LATTDLASAGEQNRLVKAIPPLATTDSVSARLRRLQRSALLYAASGALVMLGRCIR
jgi:hypothetical protein